ncbi:MAG TPA: c-type cytochrome [Rhizomicrobium sp.]|nr:c-type cytochrome [Rhizomicrobium sp.]
MKTIVAALFLLPLMPSLALAQNAAPDLAAAKSLWEGNNTQCRNCHGKTGEGAFGPDLAGRGLNAAQFQQAVRKPWGIMPAFVDTQISDADLAGLAAYFASLPKNPAPAAWRYTAEASDPHGQQVFHDVGCAQCHGPTFDMPRGTLGGLNADFALFKELIYTHTAKMEEVDASLAAGNPPPAAPQGGGNRPPLRMGNFSPTRVTEAQLKDIYDWARNDIGFRPLLQGRLSPGMAAANGVTYTLNLANNGLKTKGLTAQGLTVDLVIPAGITVAAATGDGYKGVHRDAAAKGNVAEWLVPKMAPKDRLSFTITLSKPGTASDNLKGTIRWAKPGPKTGPNLDVQNIAPPPPPIG